MQKVRDSLLILLLLALPQQLFASDPPPLSPEVAPQAIIPTQPDHALERSAPRLPARPLLSRAEVEELRLSGALHAAALDLVAKPTISTGNTTSPDTTAGSDAPATEGIVGATTVSAASVRVTNDSLMDAETAVSAVNIGAGRFTAVTHHKYIPLGGERPEARIHFARTSDFWAFTTGQLPILAGYARSADPVMSVNPYTAGINPSRMYTAGVLFNAGVYNDPSAIVLWTSADGGASWASPSIVEARGGGGYFVDKPAINVSWHPATLGYVYVAYISIDTVNSISSLVVERSTDGGLSFGSTFVVAIGPRGTLQAPQIVTNKNSGEVYVLWTDSAADAIKMATSVNQAASFGPHEIVAYGVNAIAAGGVRSYSNPIARFNYVAGSLGVVWHKYGPSLTDIYYTYKTCGSSCSGSWSSPSQVNDISTNDQFLPSMDFDNAGNFMVAWYDRRLDPLNDRYDEYAVYITPQGSRVNNQASVRLSTYSSDPDHHTSSDGDSKFIGDYQDVWFWTYTDGETANVVHIGIPSDLVNGEVYLTRVAP